MQSGLSEINQIYTVGKNERKKERKKEKKKELEFEKIESLLLGKGTYGNIETKFRWVNGYYSMRKEKKKKRKRKSLKRKEEATIDPN